MVFEKMEYIETVKYKNQLVPVFIDDYGQCFYAIYKNREIVFGAYQDNYEEEIKYLIDRDWCISIFLVNTFTMRTKEQIEQYLDDDELQKTQDAITI